MFRVLAFWAFVWMSIGWGMRPLMAQPLPDRLPLHGVVVDQDGKPLPGVYLSIRRQNSEGSFAFWGAETSADEQGNFTFSSVEEGEYYLSGELDGYSSLSNRSISWKKRSDPIRIQLTRFANVRLRFLAPDGTPYTQKFVWVRLVSINGEPTVQRFLTNALGQIQVRNITATTYSLWAHTSTGYATKTLELTSKDAAPVIDIRLQKGGSIKAVAHDSDGVALGGATFTLMPASPEEATRLGSLAADTNEDYAIFGADGDRSNIVTRDGDGNLEIQHLPPGRYSASLSLAGFTSFAPRIIDVQEGQITPLEWTYVARRAGSLTLDLRTLDDKPVANREVSVRVLPININGTLARESVDENGFGVPFFPAGTGARRAVSDATGRIRIFPLRSGRYRIFVAPRGPNPTGTSVKETAPMDLDVGESGATATVILP